MKLFGKSNFRSKDRGEAFLFSPITSAVERDNKGCFIGDGAEFANDNFAKPNGRYHLWVRLFVVFLVKHRVSCFSACTLQPRKAHDSEFRRRARAEAIWCVHCKAS